MEQIILAPWARYRSKLLPIIEHTQNRNSHQFASDIDQALHNRRAFLFLAADGFMVLQPVPESGVVSVNIMFAYNAGGDAAVRFQPVVEQLTRDIGGRSVHFYTKVLVLQPIAERLGYEFEQIDNGILKFRKIL